MKSRSNPSVIILRYCTLSLNKWKSEVSTRQNVHCVRLQNQQMLGQISNRIRNKKRQLCFAMLLNKYSSTSEMTQGNLCFYKTTNLGKYRPIIWSNSDNQFGNIRDTLSWCKNRNLTNFRLTKYCKNLGSLTRTL